jgi:hypothetical protein
MSRGPKVVEDARIVKAPTGWFWVLIREEFWLHPTKGWRKGRRTRKTVPLKRGYTGPQVIKNVTWAGK